MNRSIRDIYDDYRYELLKVGMSLDDISLEKADIETVEPLLEKAERLEALVDLYAYLLACQGGGSRR